MEIDESFALLITWTCYGTWLPGDERGHVSNTLSAEGPSVPRQNVYGTPCAADDAYTRERARAAQKWPAALLSADHAFVAGMALARAARQRGWRIPRAAIMRNHVHVVVTDCPHDGPAVRRVLKGVSQAAMNDHVGENRRWWTAKGSDRYKRGDRAVEAAINYVANQPGRLVEVIDLEVRLVEQPDGAADSTPG